MVEFVWPAALTVVILMATSGGIASAIKNTSDNQTTSNSGCSKTEFRCLDLTCIPITKKCDGHKDCYLHEDELNCNICDPGFFHCEDGHCISEDWVCDGVNDCYDLSDEIGCEKITPNNDITCPAGEFICGGLCILEEWLCDGTKDCIEGEDELELNCPKSNTTKKCTDMEFECSPGICIPHRWVCDGSSECPNGEDEGDHCGEYREDCRLDQGYFKCENITNSRCLNAANVCDKIPQCPNKEDEGSFCATPGCGDLVCAHKCIESSQGPSCYCPSGLQLSTSGVDCVDINECEEYGKCSQLCLNSYGNYSCSCEQGYKMINNTCYASGADVLIYLSTEDSIRSYNVRTNVYRLVLDGLDHVVGIGYDGIDDRLYFTDVRLNRERIESVRSNGRDRRMLLETGLDMPEDIVIDEAGRNFYFSDSTRGHIVVCTLDGYSCAIVDANPENPRGMAIHNKEKRLFYSDWGSRPMIVRIGLDGSDRCELVTEGLHWPNGVAVDQQLSRVYWSDAKIDILESASTDGSDRRVVLQEINMLHPFSLTIFEDTLYWSDWSGGMLASCNKFTGKQRRTILKEAGLKIMGITAYHPLLAADMHDPCKGHQCSHICAPKPRAYYSYTCLCPDQLVLARDGRTCTTRHIDALVVGVKGRLYRLDPHAVGKHTFEVIGSVNGEVGDIVNDIFNGNLYVSDADSDAIYSIDVHKTGRNGGERSLVSFDPFLSHLTLDSIDLNLFWIDAGKHSVMVQSSKRGATKAIIPFLSNPRAMTYSNQRRRLYILDEQKLIECSPQGDNQRVVSNNVPLTVRHLYYHEASNTLAMGDSEEGSVHLMDLSTGDLTVFLEGLAGITSMVIFNGHFYWTQHTGSELFWIDFKKSKASLSNIAWMSLKGISESPLDLARLSISSNRTSDLVSMERPCLTAECEQFCFSDSGSAVCSCEFGHNLLDDGKSCQAGCPSNLFACNDTKHRCIKHDWVCDGTVECLNGRDEANCSHVDTCDTTTSFKCDNGECLRELSYRCDSDVDCADGSDEKDCPPIKCNEDHYFQCKEKPQCVLNIWVCDDHEDCKDGSDEKECAKPPCEEGFFTCQDGLGCIPNRWVCDGKGDCNDESDENANCTLTAAKEDCAALEMYQCVNGLCIDLALVCDNENDCGDGSDEQEGFCQRREPPKRARTCQADNVDESFSCDGICLPQSARCNGTVECTDGSDEYDCEVHSCKSGTWMCSNRKECVSKSWLCDGENDCSDGSDEENCASSRAGPVKSHVCRDDQYRCNSGECVSMENVCNGYADCEDGSDESETKCKVCSLRNGGCAHKCQPTPNGAICSCEAGFLTKTIDGRVSCEDMDECKLLSSCPQLCTNTKGSFKCSCASGFISERSGDQCRALGEDQKILLVEDSKIKAITQSTGSHHLLADYTAFARSVAVNQWTGQLFTTLPARNLISLSHVDGILTATPKRVNNTVWLSGINRPDLVAVDWLTGNVYYTQQMTNVITVCSTNKNCTALMKTVYAHITDVALDPLARRMFVAAFKNGFLTHSEGGVWNYGMDGSTTGSVKLSGHKLTVSAGVTVDIHSRRVFWADRNRGFIMSNNYEGTNLLPITALEHVPLHLATFQNTLYWINHHNNKITTFELMSGSLRESPEEVHITPATHSITIIQEQLQPKRENPCQWSKCSHICLLSSGPQSFTCACPDGLTFSPTDSSKCVSLTAAGVTLPTPSPAPPSATGGDTAMRPQHESGDSADQSNEESNVGSDVIDKQPVTVDNSSTAIAAVIVVVVLAVGGILLVLWWYKWRGNKLALPEDMLAFTNHAHTGSPDIGYSMQATNDDEIVGVQVVKRGTIVSCDNPLFVDSPVTPKSSGLGSKLDFLKFRSGQPRMASIGLDSPNVSLTGGANSPHLDFSSIMCVAKGASTPTRQRKDIHQLQDTDSAFIEPSVSASMDYDDISDQHTSVSFYRDNQNLLNDN